MHIDMDAFFASVEQRDDLSLRGKPVAVIGANARTVVVTSSYQARAMGVKTGMNRFQAKNVCPQVIFVEAHHEKYTAICEQIVKILYRFSPDVEVYSIDESFLDITGVGHLFGTPLETGRKIKDAILKELNLTCSIGIGPNKLIAKLASKQNKPDGLLWIGKDRVSAVLKDLPVEELCGIGNSTKEALNRMGIYTCSELAAQAEPALRRKFGVLGPTLMPRRRTGFSNFILPIIPAAVR